MMMIDEDDDDCGDDVGDGEGGSDAGDSDNDGTCNINDDDINKKRETTSYIMQSSTTKPRDPKQQIDGLVQDCSNSIALAMELLQSCTKPSK